MSSEQRYPAAVRTFTDSWERFTPFLDSPADGATGHLSPTSWEVPPPPTRSRLRATSCARSPGTGVTSPPTRQRSSCRKLAICNTRGQGSPTTAKGAAQRTGRQERDHRQADRGRHNHQLEASPPTAVPGLSRPNQPPPVTHTTYTNNLTGSRWTTGSAPTLRKTSSALRWVVPLISGHQRPAAAGDFRPRII